MKNRYWIWVLWPSFLIACVAEVLLFTFVSPEDIIIFGSPVDLSGQAVYTIGFFILWVLGASSSAFTMLVLPEETNNDGLM